MALTWEVWGANEGRDKGTWVSSQKGQKAIPKPYKLHSASKYFQNRSFGIGNLGTEAASFPGPWTSSNGGWRNTLSDNAQVQISGPARWPNYSMRRETNPEQRLAGKNNNKEPCKCD